MNIVTKIINKVKEFLSKKRDSNVTETPIEVTPVHKKSQYNPGTKRKYQDSHRDAINTYQREWQREYRGKNKEVVDANRREYQHKNREKLSAYQSEWNKVHRAEINIKKRERYHRNKEINQARKTNEL